MTYITDSNGQVAIVVGEDWQVKLSLPGGIDAPVTIDPATKTVTVPPGWTWTSGPLLPAM